MSRPLTGARTGTRLSPLTGWERGDWAALADRMLAAVRPFASPGHALLTLPGPTGGYGAAVDGLEGFARTFLLAGFRLAGEGGADPGHLAEWYAAGLSAGTDPAAPDRWVRLEEHAQAKVEAASIALILDLTRPWLWDGLDPVVQERVVDYLAAAVGDDTYPRINWVWFRLVVQTFLRSVGGPHQLDEMRADLTTHDSFVRADGWLADGDERSYDHYAGWALHLYPVLWSRMAGAADLAPERRDVDVARLDRYLQDAVELVGADGSPLLQGRSLVYRFAAAAPFWAGAMAGVPSVPPGQLRRAASGVVRHFADRGAPDERGLLTLGWHHEWPRLAQSYSGTGSPYWASKGMLGLALPADHPVWTAVEEPLPLETGDRLRVVRAAGWVVAGTRDDGVVRVVNHGTDHAVPGAAGGDSPLYARLGYSTATSPLLDDAAWTDPLDQSVVLLDDAGRASHRTGMQVLDVAPVGDRTDGVGPRAVGVAASRARAHWLAADESGRRHGSGLPGVPTDAGVLTTVSVVRGAWEVRLVHAGTAAAAARSLRIGGWPLAGTTAPDEDVAGSTAVVRTPDLISVVTGRAGLDRAGVTRSTDASPLGAVAGTPWVAGPVPTDAWAVAVVGLSGPGAERPVGDRGAEPRVDVATAGAPRATVVWADGAHTEVLLPVGGDRA
ncbi:DUF2264 domain-containing protein [uncultured Cellulomonas sp.]|uniref:DUF2264 domain-containing protein n=1 Tax=uncultured Cellulomonas sp. TaxID=189682 RepID=UPI002606B54E|nr:DUF2264 domain-containing protein [uncultured Cellulomonas sp.]